MANYSLSATKAQNFHSDSIPELLCEASTFIENLDENYTVTDLSLSYDENFDPYVTVYYE